MASWIFSFTELKIVSIFLPACSALKALSIFLPTFSAPPSWSQAVIENAKASRAISSIVLIFISSLLICFLPQPIRHGQSRGYIRIGLK
ncbi:unknown protein [Desulfotalea psychrophila LSv54]|uniref:Uncharacterized protein n=1 Tax=Desulfotalea psychrophila (strain LSv54 / DSM 12343) TaxID=177439 RepID=Q6APF7_DESPS|nr:unknown protein [Desulfotalea psychrophila LSv54]